MNLILLHWLNAGFVIRLLFMQASRIDLFRSVLSGATIVGIGLVWAGAPIASRAEETLPEAKKISFNRDIRHILSDKCFSCHGPDEGNRKAHLRLDLQNKAHEKAIEPGHPEKSELVSRIYHTDPDELMPPPESGKSLTDEEKSTLEKWIAEGAEYESHWAFISPTRPDYPQVSNKNWARNGIDPFILARIEAAELTPGEEADRRALIRRVTLDLTGLPPTLKEVEEFVNDSDPGAYEALVDRLLRTPQYGEHMARYWLDLARYGDTHGLHLDNYREMWPYRDWVVQAFTENMPYDEFITEQLAGDLLPNASVEQLVATGFNRAHVTTSEGGSITEEVYVRNVVDRVQTMGTVMMGMTIGCAVCHDHKFDPVSQKEFYQLFAYFNSLDGNPLDGNRKDPAPVIRVPTQDQKERMARFENQSESIEKSINAFLETYDYQEPNNPRPVLEPERTEVVIWDDALPEGVQTQNGWEFVSREEFEPFSGEKSARRTSSGRSQHLWQNASKPIEIGEGDVLFAYAYLDPANPPKEVMMQWNDTQGWEHRVYWGENLIEWGTDNTPGRFRAGDLPSTGEWVRLEVAVADVGLKAGQKVNGWAFTQFDGTLYWDKAGIVSKAQGATLYDSLAQWIEAQRGMEKPDAPEEIAKILKGQDPLTGDALSQVEKYFVGHAYRETQPLLEPLYDHLKSTQQEARQFENNFPTTLVWKEKAEPKPAYLLKRGQYDTPGDQVNRAVPAFLPEFPEGASNDRLGLAKWLTRDDHPLTARVQVNRLWQQVFGKGIVSTAGDFGSQGSWPTHPMLLDWLAVEFRESGWDIKEMMRTLVTSATYRQSVQMTPEKLKRDPSNFLYARGPRYRLDAETLRDQALAFSGLLNPKIGGPGVKPPQPDGLWFAVGYTGSNTSVFKADTGDEKVHRRSIYTFWKRTSPPPQMAAFDAPSREACTVTRERTNTPLQALLLMNDPQFFEAARGLGERVLREGGDTLESRIDFLFELTTARKPNAVELEELKSIYADYRSAYQADPEAARNTIQVGELQIIPEMSVVELATWTMMGNLILNLDEVVNKS